MNNLEERRIRIGIKRKVIPKNELEISDEAMGSERELSNGILIWREWDKIGRKKVKNHWSQEKGLGDCCVGGRKRPERWVRSKMED